MALIRDFEYGYAKGEDTMWCIRRSGVQARMLCGRDVGFVPVVQPEHPRLVHRECLEVMYGSVQDRSGRPGFQVTYVTCPACEGEAPVFEGRIQSHGIWRVGAEGEPYQSEIPCMGVNLRVRRRR
jgi:hypothetical protein